MIPLSSAVGKVISTKLTLNINCGVTGMGTPTEERMIMCVKHLWRVQS